MLFAVGLKLAHLNAKPSKSILNINCIYVPMNSICQTKVVIVSRTLTEARSEQRPVFYDILVLSQITCPSQLRLQSIQLPSPTRVRRETVTSGHWHDTILVEGVRTIARAFQSSLLSLYLLRRMATRTICNMSSPTGMSTFEYAGRHSLF